MQERFGLVIAVGTLLAIVARWLEVTLMTRLL